MYDIELKNQTGESIIYNEIGEISIPLANNSGEGTFVARHEVRCELPEGVKKYGSEKCAFSVDCLSLIVSDSISLNEANVDVYVSGELIFCGTGESPDVASVQKSEKQIVINIPGTIITGDISINVEV